MKEYLEEVNYILIFATSQYTTISKTSCSNRGTVSVETSRSSFSAITPFSGSYIDVSLTSTATTYMWNVTITAHADIDVYIISTSSSHGIDVSGESFPVSSQNIQHLQDGQTYTLPEPWSKPSYLTAFLLIRAYAHQD